MSNSSILLLIFIVTATQILYSIKNNSYGYNSNGIPIILSIILSMVTLLSSLLIPIKFVNKERVELPSFIDYKGAFYLITNKTKDGLSVIEVKNTNATVNKITFESFFGCELVDYEIVPN